MDPAEQLLTTLRVALADAGDPARASGQQRYMKSALPFHGVAAPQVRQIVKAAVAAHPLPDRTSWLAVVARLWDDVTHREEWYAALGVLRHRRYRAWASVADQPLLALLRHLVTSGAWWDVVDEASLVAGDLLRTDRTTMTAVLRDWSRQPDLWLRRVSIIAQRGHRSETDLTLLGYAIEGSLGDRDFFARKAIGWALREHSKTDPAWVRGYLASHASRLSPLSRREALKWLQRRPTS